MRNLIISSLSFLVGASAWAAGSVSVATHRIDLNLRLYEVCGVVTGFPDNSNLPVDIVVDPGKYAGHYVTHTSADGKFCQIARVMGNSYEVVIPSVNSRIKVQAKDGATATSTAN